MKKISKIQGILIKVIELYQKYLSPDHSDYAKKHNHTPYCRYFPTCSEYTKEAIEKKWAFIWSLKWVWRILRCMPWSKWWYDPVESCKKDREK